MKGLLIFALVASIGTTASAAGGKKTSSSMKVASNSTTATSAKKINASEDIDSLGGNKDLMTLAEGIKSSSRSRIVQERIVDRNNRVEIGLLYGGIFGGDSYLKTQTFGAALDFHINPRWSIGARYYDYSNNLTAEGDRIYNNARAARNMGSPSMAVDIDYLDNAAMAVVNWYPIYGKTSFMDLGVTQFDIYLIAGAGQLTLSSGGTPVYTGGAGIAAWISKNFSLRAEGRYQKYTDKIVTGSRDLDAGVASIGMGWML